MTGGPGFRLADKHGYSIATSSETEPMSTPPLSQPDASNAKLVYYLYLIGLAVGITGLVGVVMAYLNLAQAPAWLQTHYRVQIRTFWIGLLFAIIGGITSVILIGWLVLLFTAVWLVIRCVKGLQYAERGEAIPDPTTWLWGS